VLLSNQYLAKTMAIPPVSVPVPVAVATQATNVSNACH